MRAPPSHGSTRTQIRDVAGVCLTAFPSRFSTIRSIFALSQAMTMDVVFTSTSRSVSSSESATSSQTRAPTSVGRNSGSTMPRVSRSRSSRSVTSRSSFRAFWAIRRARSRISSWSSCRSSRAIVTASPRIPASGVRRSCETACRNVFFISSTTRRRCAVSRSRVRSCSSSCVCLCSVMSISTPCQYFGLPSSSRMSRA